VQTASGSLSAADVDNATTFVAQTNVAGTNGYGTFSITSAGAWTYTMDSAHAEFVSGQNYTDSITVTSADGTSQVITVTIAGANDAAVISGTITGAVTEAGGVSNGTAGTPTATGTLTSTDEDGTANAFTAVAAGAASTGGYGTYAMTAGGVWTYTLNDSNVTVQALAANATLNDTFTVAAADGTTQVSTVTITGANDAPVAVADTKVAVEAGGASNGTAGTNPTGNVLANDTDVDSGDIRVVSALSGGTLGSAKAGSYGSLVLNADGSYTYTVDNSNATVQALGSSANTLTDTFTYTVTDAAGATSSATLALTVQGANDAPEVQVALADKSYNTNTAFSFDFSGNTGTATDSFKDVDTGHQTGLTYTATLADGSALPSWLGFNANTRTFSGTSSATASTTSVKVTASDGSLSASDTFDIVLTIPPSATITALTNSVTDAFSGTPFGDYFQVGQVSTITSAAWTMYGTYNGGASNSLLFVVPSTSQNAGFTDFPGDQQLQIGGGSNLVKFTSLGGNFTSISFQTGRYYYNNGQIDGQIYTPIIRFYDASNVLLGSAITGSTVSTYSPVTQTYTVPGGLSASYFTFDYTLPQFGNQHGGTSVLLDNVTATYTDGSSAPTSTCSLRPALSGTMAGLGATDVVAVYEDGVYLGNATLSGSTWTYTPSADRTAGMHSYSVKVESSPNNVSHNVLAVGNTWKINLLASPLVLDLNGDGIQTVGLDQAVSFDLSASGSVQKTAWIDRHDGLLAMDLNHDGQINSGAELLGNNTVLADGSKAADGWAALAALDSNGDGLVDAQDARFADLRVWVDANGDAITDAGELKTLADVGISSLAVAHQASLVQQNGNTLDGVGQFTKADGSTGSMTDAWLQVQQAVSLDLSQVTTQTDAHGNQQVLVADGVAQSLTLNLANVMAAPARSDGVHAIKVDGDAVDVITLGQLLADGTQAPGQWVADGLTVVDGHSFNGYRYSGFENLLVLIDNQIVTGNVHLT
jgi:VCBS repeat-containing protein